MRSSERMNIVLASSRTARLGVRVASVASPPSPSLPVLPRATGDDSWCAVRSQSNYRAVEESGSVDVALPVRGQAHNVVDGAEDAEHA